MAGSEVAVLHARHCRRCEQAFAICCGCDRGHRYGSRPCSEASQREQRRQAKRRQQQTSHYGQSDLRRLVDPRLLAAAGVGPATGDPLAGLLLAAVGRLRPRQGAGLRRGPRARRQHVHRRHAGPAQGVHRQPTFCRSSTSFSDSRSPPAYRAYLRARTDHMVQIPTDSGEW
jgi:hypothetical protein